MKRRGVAAVAVAAMIWTGACGDSGGDEKGAAALSFCDAKAALDAVSPDTPDEEALKAYQDEVDPLFDSLIDAMPDALETDAETWRDSVLEPSTLADAAQAVEDPTVAEAKQAVAVAVHRDCDFPRVDFKTVDNRFEAAPQRVKPGQVSILLENGGAKIHAIVLFRLNDGVTAAEGESAIASDELESKGTFANAVPAAAGTSAGIVTELKPGLYLYFDDEHPEEMKGTFVVAE